MAKILVVEDDRMISRILVHMLENFGHTVVGPARTLEEGITLAISADIDVAVLDIQLGSTDSYPIAYVLRSRNIPYLFGTGYENIDNYEFRFDPQLIKPYRMKELMTMISQLVEKRRVLEFA